MIGDAWFTQIEDLIIDTAQRTVSNLDESSEEKPHG